MLLARAREETAAARTALDAAIAEVDARTRQLRQAAAERRMPTADEQVDAIARAAAEFENAAAQLHAERASWPRPKKTWPCRPRRSNGASWNTPQAEEVLAERERLQRALEEEFRTLEETVAADVQQVLEQIRETEQLIAAANQAWRELDARARAEHDQGHRRRGRTARPAAVAGRGGPAAVRAGRAVRRVRPADLRLLAGVTDAAPWPDPARWPDPDQSGADLAACWPTARFPQTRRLPCARSCPRAWPGSSTRSLPPAAADGR